ncbi:MAG TPA: hypothetical protein VGT06_06535, partial [Candidatus Methylomirabilis sp.]|nr:hypothetical protein [Candidatus Methylomirabilis sp.]
MRRTVGRERKAPGRDQRGLGRTGGPQAASRQRIRPDARAAARRILDRLSRHYPDARVELEYSTPLQLLVATILSAQCTD